MDRIASTCAGAAPRGFCRASTTSDTEPSSRLKPGPPRVRDGQQGPIPRGPEAIPAPAIRAAGGGSGRRRRRRQTSQALLALRAIAATSLPLPRGRFDGLGGIAHIGGRWRRKGPDRKAGWRPGFIVIDVAVNGQIGIAARTAYVVEQRQRRSPSSDGGHLGVLGLLFVRRHIDF
mmetsp:Transcript_92011/g.264765  ORF Transcript_92011/g.264765 Transcript_92011/m.264765 type:complete len:175 (+) Transcript_92011:2-526(+)